MHISGLRKTRKTISQNDLGRSRPRDPTYSIPMDCFMEGLNAVHPGTLIGGRLGMCVEGSGKRRVFAIGNYVKQRLLRPYHDWCMKVFSLIPMDGTYDPSKPLRNLREGNLLLQFLPQVCH